MKKQQFIKQSKAQVCSFNFTHYSFTHWRASLMNRVFSLHKEGSDHVSSKLIYQPTEFDLKPRISFGSVGFVAEYNEHDF